MTDVQRVYVEETRDYLQRETMLRVGSHAREKRLLRIIDTQEAELRSARDTIARYEAMMESMGGYIRLAPMGGGDQEIWLQRVAGEWTFNHMIKNHYANHAGGFATALDAYEALKEATP